MNENEGVRGSFPGIAITSNLAILVDGQSLSVCSSQRGQVGYLPIGEDKGVKCIVLGQVRADDLTSVVDCIGGLEVIRLVRAADAKILDRAVGKHHGAMIPGATLAIAHHCPTTVNPKCFAGGGAVQCAEGDSRLGSRKQEGQEIPVPVLAVASDLSGIVDGARSIDLAPQGAHLRQRLIRRGIKECSIIFSLKTIPDDFPLIADTKRYAIGALGRRNSSDLVVNLRERCRSKANRVDPREEDSQGLQNRLARTGNWRRVSSGSGCALQKTGAPVQDFLPRLDAAVG
jgi:hypothetical protein